MQHLPHEVQASMQHLPHQWEAQASMQHFPRQQRRHRPSFRREHAGCVTAENFGAGGSAVFPTATVGGAASHHKGAAKAHAACQSIAAAATTRATPIEFHTGTPSYLACTQSSAVWHTNTTSTAAPNPAIVEKRAFRGSAGSGGARKLGIPE